jgi:hypothetical protein
VNGNKSSQLKVGPRRLGATGWEYVHIAIDDCTRLAYAEVLPDEKATTIVGFLKRAIAFYAATASTSSSCSPTTEAGTDRRSTPSPAAPSQSGIYELVPTDPEPTEGLCLSFWRCRPVGR